MSPDPYIGAPMTIIVINQVEFEMGSLLWKHGGYATDLSLKVENHTPKTWTFLSAYIIGLLVVFELLQALMPSRGLRLPGN